jgi:alpha-D-xyloside xylohydrolase
MYLLESHTREVVFSCGEMRVRVGFVTPSIVRVTCAAGKLFLERQSRIVTFDDGFVACEVMDEDACFRVTAGSVVVVLDKSSGALSYVTRDGKVLMREPELGGRWLTPKEVFRNEFAKDTAVAYAQSIDGARASVSDFAAVLDRTAFEAKLEFVFADDEALFGFGSHEEGYGNLRGKSRDLYQQNMKAVVPSFVSTRGYGVLFECSSLMTFHDDAYGSYWWADVVDELDFYVVEGETFDEVTRGFHALTGGVPMLPKWAFEYVQSKERYVNARELLAVAAEYRRRKIPLDVLVLDWKSWPDGAGWGQKTFDVARFPDAEALTAELHAMGVRLMVSIWPIMTGGCENQRELLEAGMMLGNQSTYNAFNDAARERYWNQAERGLFSKGVDAWWCDCTEPFEADWSGAVKPEPHTRLAINTNESKLYLDAGEINAYSLMHSRGIYEGQRRATDAKRVLNLTRSSYAGQHRYGTVTWNGDTCATWETLRRCIPEGLNFCATGEPYWTVDIGGFFVDHDPRMWFWRGDYADGCRGLTDMHALEPDPMDTGCKDLGFWELYTRWLQYAVFLPMFRSHGTDAAREIWRFGDEGGQFYDVLARYIRLRYELMPYIYSLAARVTFASESMIRAVALEFPEDVRTHEVVDQFLFGRGLMVCPVVEAMYFETGLKPVAGVEKTRAVYLPRGARWFDFWTNRVLDGGQVMVADSPLETIPLYVRAGSIVPMTRGTQYVDEVRDAAYEIRVYAGADAEFVLYEDGGDGYGYEAGEYASVTLSWKESLRELTIGARSGSFPGLVAERDYQLRLVCERGCEVRVVRYVGEMIRLRFEETYDGEE